MADREPTHGDILERIGELKGKMDSLTLLVTQKREDLNNAVSQIRTLESTSAKREDLKTLENRVGKVENNISNWVGACLAISFLFSALPVVFRYIVAPHPERREPAVSLTSLTNLSPWITPTDSAASTSRTPTPLR